MTFDEQVEAVMGALKQLDGTRLARIALLSGLSREKIEELGGVK